MIITKDNIFENPNYFRMDALKKYKNNLFECGENYPGKRCFIYDDTIIKYTTEKIRKILNQSIVCKNLSYNFIDTNYCQGFPHDDRGRKYTCIIYLNQQSPQNTGTEIYDYYFNSFHIEPYIRENENIFLKKSFFGKRKRNIIDMYLYNNNINRILKGLGQKVVIPNKYNRLLLFDSNLVHRAQKYFGSGDNSRLCMVGFFN